VRWRFGERALSQTQDLAAVMRRVIGLVTSLEREEAVVDVLVAQLTHAEHALSELVPGESTPRVGQHLHSDGRVYLDHARDIGAFNACFPEYDIAVDGDQARGTVCFPLAYEGPPGLVHGGFIAVLFDCIIQHHNCDVGRTGKTTSLTVSYRRPTPLDTDLRFSISRSDDGDRILSRATLMIEDRVLCEAEMSAVASDRANLSDVSPRRIDHDV
jgi:hypothetical protein